MYTEVFQFGKRQKRLTECSRLRVILVHLRFRGTVKHFLTEKINDQSTKVFEKLS